MICEDILKLTEYGMVTGLVPKEDERFTINRLLELFELEELDEDAVAAYQSRTPMSREEAEEILQLYRSLIGTEYCVWTENYPTEREVEFDLSRNALFCLYERMPEPDERERLIGTISIDDDPEVEALSCWSEDLTPVAELSRLGVAVEYQNRGIARILLQEAMAELKSQGYKAVHILVAKDNVKALRSYEKLHFTTAGECELFGHSYWCYEKEL